MSTSNTLLSTLLLLVPSLVMAGGTASVTPHDMYSSSIGVLGCKINANRVAYWPGAVDCAKLCVKLTGPSGKSLHVLKVDQSQDAGGVKAAHDISLDAWRQLSGQDYGGGVDMTWEDADWSACADLVPGGKLPLSAANSMNFYSNCVTSAPGSPGAEAELWDIQDPRCQYGTDKKCTPPDLAAGFNQADCGGQSNPQAQTGLKVDEVTLSRSRFRA